MHNFNDIQIIIMAGGVGSRFWPMSTPDYPKQFIDVMGVGRSLIQLTVDRLKPICPVENLWGGQTRNTSALSRNKSLICQKIIYWQNLKLAILHLVSPMLTGRYKRSFLKRTL